MSIISAVIGAVSGNSVPTYTIAPATTSTNEGSSLTFNVTGTNIVNGTYYWTIETNSGDFETTSGSFAITSNTGTFTVTPTADHLTEGAETFTVALRSVSTSGTILVTSSNVTINDTSLTPEPPFSLNFPGTGNPYLLVSNTQSDWNLGTTYTIEFWSKGGNASTGVIRTVASQGPGNGIDVGYISTHLLFRYSEPQYPEPTPGVWTHVAFVSDGEYVNLYYNGVYQTNFNPNGGLIDGGSDLDIGRRAGVNGQGFYGKLAMIRVSTAAKYVANFNPSLSYGVESDTRLMLGSNNPVTDLALYELNGVNTSANNLDTLYFSKATYPDLNTQIHAGDTVVNVAPGSLVNSITTGTVFTADPYNWGVHVSPGWPAVDTVNFSGPGRHPISVQGAVGISTDFPNFQSLEFNQPEQDFLSTPASADWNLGTTYTIEFWMKANNASGDNIHIPGGQWGLINQTGWYGGMQNNSILIGLSANNLTIAQDPNNDIQFAEPTAGVWTHVAFVNNGGGSAQKLYYNGVEQTKVSGSYQSNGWTNTTATLYIGRLAPVYGSHFDGKMAMVRISNTAKYLNTFTSTTSYGVEADTKLFLGKVDPTVDSLAHAITNNGVTLISDFPVAPPIVGGFVFQNAGFNYSIDGIGYPTLTLIRGGTYTFDLTQITASHPWALRLSSGDTSVVPGTTGGTGNGGSGNNSSSGVFGTSPGGTVTTTVVYQVPLDAPSSIVYQCVYHSEMIGTINITN